MSARPERSHQAEEIKDYERASEPPSDDPRELPVSSGSAVEELEIERLSKREKEKKAECMKKERAVAVQKPPPELLPRWGISQVARSSNQP